MVDVFWWLGVYGLIWLVWHIVQLVWFDGGWFFEKVACLLFGLVAAA